MEDRFKFRAWYRKNKEVCEVLSIDYPNGIVIMESRLEDKIIEVDIGQVKLLQCTGRKDKHNKLIYDDHILRREKKRGHEIKRVEWSSKPYCNDGWNIGPSHEKESSWEIIGNFFENSDLLR